MNPGHWQPQIIRLFAAASLVVLAVSPHVEAQPAHLSQEGGVPCVSCLVIGLNTGGLDSAHQVAPGSLQGVQLLVTTSSRGDALLNGIRTLTATGASVALLVSPPQAGNVQEAVFATRTTITDRPQSASRPVEDASTSPQSLPRHSERPSRA